MSYQVLARKWRPGKFSELVGQEHVVSAISNALDNDRLHHAYLFTGTRGVGKTTIARIFSKSLNCEEGQGANPCGQCDTCKEIEQGNYVDLLEIDAASRTKVEDTRELLDNVQYKPTRGRYKVYLIDEVHMLSKHSFNALLKTLEEPPPHVKFLLATTDPQKLPITILSRCLQFNLKAMSREQIVGQLTHILEQEQLSFEPQALLLLARAAQGSMRDALSLTDQAIAQGGNQVIASVVTDMLGLMDKNQLLKVINAVVNKTPNDVIQLVNDLAEQAPDYDNVHSELTSLLHQIALTQWVPEACKLETTSAKAIYQLAKTIPAEQVQLLYQIAIQGRKDLPFAADGKSALEMTLMRMMSFAPATPPDNGAETIEHGGSEHSLPIQASPKSQTGDPGNVGKQEDALKSETLADSTPQVGIPEPQIQSQPITDIASEFEVMPEPEKPLEPEIQPEPEKFEPSSKAVESQSESSPFSGSEPPLDAYMDDIPPPSDDDYTSVIENSFSSHANSDFDIKTANLANHAEPHDQQNAGSEQGVSQDTIQPSPEEQLSATAGMLALRQKMKQRKAQDSEAKKAQVSTESASQSAADRMSDTLRSRFSNASATPALQNNQAQASQPHIGHEESVQNQFHSTSRAPLTEPESSHNEVATDLTEPNSTISDSTTDFISSVDSSLDNGHQHNNGESAPNSEFEDTEFFDAEFDEDMPFASDPQPQANDSLPQQVPSQENSLQGLSKEDLPPWDTADSNSSADSSIITDNDLLPKSNAEQVLNQPINQQSHYEQDDSGQSNQKSSYVQSGRNQSSAEYLARQAEKTDGLGITSNSPYVSLRAYLEDGTKLTHASQIDEWSNLVEQMPIAGLLKQLFLHASFSRDNGHVSLEIDNSQSHLLNESAKQQLLDALHHGLGENVTVNISLGEPKSTPFALQQDIHTMRQAHAHSVVQTDETIQALLSIFDASVLTDSVKAR